MPSHEDDLRADILNGRVACIVGAGVTIAASYDPNRKPNVAGWQGLLEHGVSECVKLHPTLAGAWESRLLEEIAGADLDDLLAAADKITAKLRGPDGGDYARWLRETIGKLPLNDKTLIDALAGLPTPLLTTNYDTLLEQGTRRSALTWQDRSAIERVFRRDDTSIVHLHGVWIRPETVILGGRSYERVVGDQHAQAMAHGIRAMSTLLFIGFGGGLRDPNFGGLLTWARGVFSGSEYRHYRLVSDEDVERTQQEHPPEERMFVIGYGRHEDLPGFISRLYRPSSVVTVSTPPLTTPSPSPAAAGQDENWMYIGRRIIGVGEQLGASGSHWTIKIHRLLVGNISDLNEVSEQFTSMRDEDRYLVLEPGFEARVLSSPPTWQRSGSGYLLEVDVNPTVAIEDVHAIADLDVNTFGTIQGEPVVRAFLERNFQTPIGSWLMHRDFGTRIPEVLATLGSSETTLQHIINLELARLSRVPKWDSAMRRQYTPVPGIEQIDSVTVGTIDSERVTFSVSLSLRGIGRCSWLITAPLKTKS